MSSSSPALDWSLCAASFPEFGGLLQTELTQLSAQGVFPRTSLSRDARRMFLASSKDRNLSRANLLELADPNNIASYRAAPIAARFGTSPRSSNFSRW